MNDVSISVLLPVRNGEQTIELSIRSILNQTFEDFELIVLDDGSDDRSPGIIKDIRDDRIRFVCDGLKKGITPRLNEGIAFANGEYIARMDADDFAFPQRFEKQISFLRLHPEIDLLGTGMMIFKDRFTIIGKREPPEEHEIITHNPLRGFTMMHPTFMGKKEWFEKYQYQICLGSEDQDLLLRSFKESRFHNLNDILLGYRDQLIEPRKYAAGRASYLESLVRNNYVRDLSFQVKRISLYNQIKFVRDCFALYSGLEYKVLGNRARKASERELKDWHNIIKEAGKNNCEK